MDEKKEWFTLREAVALIKPEHNGYPMEEKEAVSWLLDVVLSGFLNQSGDSVLLPSYVFREPVEIWKAGDCKRGDTESFTGLVDIWIEGKSPRQHKVSELDQVPGTVDLTPDLHRTERKHGDYCVSLHCKVPGGPDEYPLIRLVESKLVRESELVVSAETLSRYASEWGLDDVLESLELLDCSDGPEVTKEAKEERLKRCVARITELRKTGLSDKDIVCRLYDTGEFRSYAVLGQAIDSDPYRSLGGSSWHKNGIRTAEREGMKKSNVKD